MMVSPDRDDPSAQPSNARAIVSEPERSQEMVSAIGPTCTMHRFGDRRTSVSPPLAGTSSSFTCRATSSATESNSFVQIAIAR